MARKNEPSGMSDEEKRALEYKIEEEEKAEAAKKQEFVAKQKKLMKQEQTKKQIKSEKLSPSVGGKRAKRITDSDGLRTKTGRQQDGDSSYNSTKRRLEKVSRATKSKEEQKNDDEFNVTAVYADDDKNQKSDFQPGVSSTTTEQTQFVLKNATRSKPDIQSIIDGIKNRNTTINLKDKELDGGTAKTKTSRDETTTQKNKSTQTTESIEQVTNSGGNLQGTPQGATGTQNKAANSAINGNANQANETQGDENQEGDARVKGKASGDGRTPSLGVVPVTMDGTTSQQRTTSGENRRTSNNTLGNNLGPMAAATLAHNLSGGSRRKRDNTTQNEYEETQNLEQQVQNRRQPTLARRAANIGKAAARMAWNLGKKLLLKLGLIGTLALVLIVILICVGILGFFMNIPGVVLDKLTKFGEDIWEYIEGYANEVVYGKDMPTDKQVEELAVYLTRQGVELEDWGFANEFIYDSKSNRVEKLTSKYLPVYMAAEQRCYLVAKDNISLSSLWKGIKELASGFFTNWDEISFGNGNIYIDEEGRTLLQIRESSDGTDKATIENKVKVFRKEQELLISRNSISDNYSKNGVEVYRYKLKYWLDKYGTPMHFFMALHLATMAPEFVYEMAINPSQGDGHRSSQGTALNTRIDMKIAVLEPGKDVKAEIVYVDIDPRTKKVKLDEEGMPVMLTIAQVRQKLNAGETVIGLSGNPQLEDILKNAEAFNEKNITSFTPYIQRVINHWFYKEVIYQGTPSEGSYAGQKINVYRVEDLDEDDSSNVRYQMYQSIQVPEGQAPSNPGDNTSNNSGGSENPGGNSGENSGGNSGGGSDNSEGPTVTPNETPTGDDRQEMEEQTQVLTGSDSASVGGFWNSLMGLIDSVGAWVGNIAGITDMFLNLPGQVLGESFSALSNIFTSMMPSNLINQFSDAWLGGLSPYVKNGLTGALLNNTNLDQYLDFNRIAADMGVDKLRDFLDPSEVITALGLYEIQSLLDISAIRNLEDIPWLVADKLELDWVQDAFYKVNSIVDLAVNPELLVSAMYQKLDQEVISKVSDQIITYANQAFNGIDASKYDEISNGLIAGISDNIVDQTTHDLQSALRNDLISQLDGQYNDVVRRVLENENAKQLTGLTIDQLEKLNTINNLDFETIQNLSNDVQEIEQQIKEGEAESQKLSALVNEIAIDYAGIDANTFYNIAKQIRDSQEKIKKASQQLIVFENVLNDYTPDERTELQLRTNIDRAETAIENINIAIDTLQVANIKEESATLYKAGTEIKRIVDTSKSKMDAMKAAILLAQATATENIVTTATTAIDELDTVTIIKFKYEKPEVTLQGFLDTADKLVTIDPKLNGLNDTIASLNEKLANANEENADEIIYELNLYRQRIALIEWLTPTEVYELQSQVINLINSVEGVKQAIYSADRIVLDQIVNVIDGIQIPTITGLAQQLISIPNAYVHSLVDTVRNIPTALIESVSRDFAESLATAITTKVSEDLSDKVSESLKEELNSNGALKTAMTSKNSNNTEDPSVEEQPVEDPENEYLTGFYIKETRLRDYMQKSEPILVPYNYEHWRKLFLVNKYLIAGTPEYDQALEEALASKSKDGVTYDTHLTYTDPYGEQRLNYNIFEDKTYIEKYGKTLWDATAGALEEAIYAQLQSGDSVGSEYLVRYFKELFNEFGDALEAEANKTQLALKKGAVTADDVQVKIKDGAIGWIFKTETVTDYINTDTNQQIQVQKSEYEPANWIAASVAELPSKKNDEGYGFKEDLMLVSPANGKVITKTDKKENELGQVVPGNIVIELKDTGDSNADGVRIVITGGNFSDVSVGATVKKGQKIGVTTTDNIKIMVLSKNTHTQVQDITKYINPPFTNTTQQTTSSNNK